MFSKRKKKLQRDQLKDKYKQKKSDSSSSSQKVNPSW
jgi:hypothetical protein